MPGMFDPDSVKWPTVGRYAAGGALAGGSLASIMALLHMLQQAGDERRKEQARGRTGEDTIVLTLPRRTKTAAQLPPAVVPQVKPRDFLPTFLGGKSVDAVDGAMQRLGEPITAKQVDAAKTGLLGNMRNEAPITPAQVGAAKSRMTKPAAAGDTQDLSEPQDTKPPKVQTRDTCTCSSNELTTNHQVRHHDGEFGKKANWQTLAMAIIAALGGGTAGYSLVDSIYNKRRMAGKQRQAEQAQQEYLDMLRPKTAAERSFNRLDYPLAFAALSLLLGSGGTAYLTKRILDEYSNDTAKQFKDPMAPQVKRIVFKTAEADEDPDITSEKIAALVGIYLDICSGRPEILGDSKCAEALVAADTDAIKMYKAAAYGEDYSSLLATLDANPKLRQLIQRVAAEKHPVLRHAKWLLKMPGISGMADRKLYEGIDQALGPKSAGFPSLVGNSPTMLGASILGSEIAENSAERGRTAAINKARANKKETPEQRAKRILSELTIATADPNAAEFVDENQGKLKELLKALALSGRI